mmetsp:Transcript_1108/g.3623  ORF Transcript_1108/g.3623 Transcript_1108/m.3623 type:complete len:230 (-) Transcript_1108:1416-2105(-)
MTGKVINKALHKALHKPSRRCSSWLALTWSAARATRRSRRTSPGNSRLRARWWWWTTPTTPGAGAISPVTKTYWSSWRSTISVLLQIAQRKGSTRSVLGAFSVSWPPTKSTIRAPRVQTATGTPRIPTMILSAVPCTDTDLPETMMTLKRKWTGRSRRTKRNRPTRRTRRRRRIGAGTNENENENFFRPPIPPRVLPKTVPFPKTAPSARTPPMRCWRGNARCGRGRAR